MNVAVFGEVLLRLSPPGKERLFQSPELRAGFGGSEANVAVSLAAWGHRVRILTVLPPNPVGEAALAELAKRGLDTSFVRRGGDRLGLYFVETGAGPRPSRVVYDRSGSGLAAADPDDFDWKKALSGCDWFHVSGITPALSAAAAAATERAVAAARAAGLTVSLDLNYRSKLWSYGKSAPEVMPGIAARADLLCANEEDCQKALGLDGPPGPGPEGSDPARYEELTRRVLRAFPALSRVAVTLRGSRDADENVWTAVLASRSGFWTGPAFTLRSIVDRVGAGDAFAAGLIHGLATGAGERGALDFAVAASALKHTIPGDFNLSTASEVEELLAGDRSGRIRR